MQLFDLSGKTALVTGGNGGIGLGVARGLASAGAQVMIAGRNAEKNAAAVANLEALGATAASLIADVNSEAACQEMVAGTVTQFGGLDILVNNAGINVRKNPEDLLEEEWNSVVQTNLNAAFLCAKAAHPHMKAAGGGKIINIGSMMSIFGARFTVAYAASKGGIVQMTKGLACAWADDNIQVNSILPGWINTDLTQGAKDMIPGFEDRIRERTPANRWGEPDDHMGLAVFLAAPASNFVTGTAIPLDGGYSVQGI